MLRRCLVAIPLIAAVAVGGLLVTALPASAAEAPVCWNPDVWARPGITRTYELYCPRTDDVEVVAQPHDTRFEGLVLGQAVRFRLTPAASAPEHDTLTLRLTGPGGTTDQVVAITNVPLSVNTPPRCDPVSTAQRTDGLAPAAIEFHVWCTDDEHDEYTLYGNGPGTHPDAPDHWTPAQGTPFWHYVPTIASGQEQTTYYAIDDLGARSADAPISVQLGPSVDRPPICHPNPYTPSPDEQPVYARPGATRRFAVICDDADGDAFTPHLTAPPTRGDITAFDFNPMPSLGFWGSKIWIDTTYVPRTRFEGTDPFTVTATGPHGSGPAGKLAIVARERPANGGGGCGSWAAATQPGTPVSLRIECDDDDGDALDVTISSPPVHGQAAAPTLTSAPYGANEIGVVYTPDVGFTGTDGLTVSVDDGGGTPMSMPMTIAVSSSPSGSSKSPYTIGTPFAWPELQRPTGATWQPSAGQAAPVSPIEQARRAFGKRAVRLVKRIGDARVYSLRDAPSASARTQALAVSCPVRCSVTSKSSVAGSPAGTAKLRLDPGKAATVSLRLSAAQRRSITAHGRARAVVKLVVARAGRGARRGTVRVTLRG